MKRRRREEAFVRLSSLHGDMLRAYRAGQWEKTEALAQGCLDVAATFRPEKFNSLYAMYRERARQYRQTPPAPGWDGVHDAASK